jgi:hypothetical protein
VQRHPFPARIAPPVRALFATLAPHAAQPLRTVFANLGALAPLAARVFARLGPELNAMVRTTAVATELSGAPGENVLATTARASINIRLLTGDTVASATARIRRIVADPAVEIEVRHGSDPRRSRLARRAVAAHRDRRPRRPRHRHRDDAVHPARGERQPLVHGDQRARLPLHALPPDAPSATRCTRTTSASASSRG